MRRYRDVIPLLVLFVVTCFVLYGTLAAVGPAYGAEEEEKELPPRAISVAPEYTGVVVPEGDDFSVDLDVRNKGQSDENIGLMLTSVPEGWKAWIKTYSHKVTGVFVASDESKSLTLKGEPEKGVGPGEYLFKIKGQTQDGVLVSESQLLVTVEAKEEVKESKDIDITTSYPVLRGPTDAKFEFSVEVKNKTDKDTIFNLFSEAPENWDVNFKPAYEDKFISSLRIEKDQSKTMAVEVKPYPWAEPGKYPVKIRVSSEKAKAEAELDVVLTGTYRLDIGTADGLLSLNAFRGKAANLSFYVKNNGSAAQNNLRFLSFKPENWKVEFEPEQIATLPPKELKQIEATITPAEQALVGDYSVGLSVEGEKEPKNLELRVTVRASTAWGWIGVGIIVIVVAGLVVLFIRLGRR